MNKFLVIILVLFSFISVQAQQFECPKLFEDARKWNEIKGSDTKRALEIKNKGLYQMDANGSFQYVYILTTTDSLNIQTLRKLGFDYISRYFNINNAIRANMETNSPEDGVIFQGLFQKLGDFNSAFEYNQVDANVYFDIRFKPNRIRFSITIQSYRVTKISSLSMSDFKQIYVSDCFPINEKSDHKNSYAKAFIK